MPFTDAELDEAITKATQDLEEWTAGGSSHWNHFHTYLSLADNPQARAAEADAATIALYREKLTGLLQLRESRQIYVETDYTQPLIRIAEALESISNQMTDISNELSDNRRRHGGGY